MKTYKAWFSGRASEKIISKRMKGFKEMRAIVAEGFSGYENLKAADIPRPAVSDGRVLVLTGTDHKRG